VALWPQGIAARPVSRANLRGEMDLRSVLKTASLDELNDLQKFLKEEIRLRQANSGQTGKVITFTDGAARGNPGPAGIGVLLFDETGKKLLEDYRYIGECTNNEAEYRALLLALERALEVTSDEIECTMDSELLVRQMNGQYAVRSEKLSKFHAEAKERAARFRKASFIHVPREHPRLRLADKLANKAIDEAKA
jgi:ribonuclease HI